MSNECIIIFRHPISRTICIVSEPNGNPIIYPDMDAAIKSHEKAPAGWVNLPYKIVVLDEI